jgi:hypothetical protein
MSAAPECILFAGPSAYGVALSIEGIDLRPPAQRGEIAALITQSKPGIIALADGVFHQTLAVGHAELRDAVEHGWQVWGLSSLGAIRACEMRHLGMRGFGDVYQRFVDDEEFADDEVALLHSPEPPYAAVSEPLVHLRAGLDALVRNRAISVAQRRALLVRLKKMWYGERTLGFVKSWLLEEGVSRRSIDGWLKAFQRFRLKSHDLQRFLEQRPYR